MKHIFKVFLSKLLRNCLFILLYARETKKNKSVTCSKMVKRFWLSKLVYTGKTHKPNIEICNYRLSFSGTESFWPLKNRNQVSKWLYCYLLLVLKNQRRSENTYQFLVVFITNTYGNVLTRTELHCGGISILKGWFLNSLIIPYCSVTLRPQPQMLCPGFALQHNTAMVQ